MIGIGSWVLPNGGPESNEIIVGRVCHVPPGEPTDLGIVWLSNERGLWRNYEHVGDLDEIPVPEIGVIEALMVSAVPTTPWNYET